MTELEELRLAYAECSRQRNELLTAHKHSAERIRVLREALRPWVDSEGGRLWVWPETALQSALQNSRAALEATK